VPQFKRNLNDEKLPESGQFDPVGYRDEK